MLLIYHDSVKKSREMKPRYKKLRAIRPNKGIEMDYRKKLAALIVRMQKEAQREILRVYRGEEAQIATDAVPANVLYRLIRNLRDKYQKLFNKKSLSLSRWFVNNVNRYTEVSLKGALEHYQSEKFKRELSDLGLLHNFRQTPALTNAAQSFVHENVNLIKSIPEKYFTEVEGMVMRGIRDEKPSSWVNDELAKRYGITTRRAIMIARDQNHKATEQLNRTRQLGLGVKRGMWQHATGVKEPRHSHEQANGKIFDLDKGLKVDGEFIFPGEKINCFPSDAKINGFGGIEKLFRRFYRGKLTCIRTSGDNTVLRATPNHPYHTLRGWVKAKDLKVGDKLIKIVHKGISVGNSNEENGVSFEDLYNAFSAFSHNSLVSGSGSCDFHGDGLINQKVNIIRTDSLLSNKLDVFKLEYMGKKFFKWPAIRSNSILFSKQGSAAFFFKSIFIAFKSLAGGLCVKPFLFRSSLFGGKSIRFLGISGLNAVSLEKFIYKSSTGIENAAKLQNAFAVKEKGYNFNFFRLFNRCRSGHNDCFLAFDEIIDINNSNYSGFVYNLQTKTGFYTVDSYIVKNCHCFFIPLLEDY